MSQPRVHPGLEALRRARELRFGDPPGCQQAALEAQELLQHDLDNAELCWEARFLELVSVGRQGFRQRALTGSHGYASTGTRWATARTWRSSI